MGDNDKVGDVELLDTLLVENYSGPVVKACSIMVFTEDLTPIKGTVPADLLRNTRMWFLMKKMKMERVMMEIFKMRKRHFFGMDPNIHVSILYTRIKSIRCWLC